MSHDMNPRDDEPIDREAYEKWEREKAAPTSQTQGELRERITAYLADGGLWNPEMANHDAVRELLRDCRDELREREMSEKLIAEILEVAQVSNDTDESGTVFMPDEQEWGVIVGLARKLATAPQTSALAEHDANLCRLDKQEADAANALIDEMMNAVGAVAVKNGGIVERNFQKALAVKMAEARLEEAKIWHNVPANHDCAEYPQRDDCKRVVVLTKALAAAKER